MPESKDYPANPEGGVTKVTDLSVEDISQRLMDREFEKYVNDDLIVGFGIAKRDNIQVPVDAVPYRLRAAECLVLKVLPDDLDVARHQYEGKREGDLRIVVEAATEELVAQSFSVTARSGSRGTCPAPQTPPPCTPEAVRAPDGLFPRLWMRLWGRA